MGKILKYCALVVFILSHITDAKAASVYRIVVAADGSGNFTTVSAAIESLPMYCYARTEIFVKNGTYKEKIRINRDYITLVGESRENTRIEYAQLRQDWIDHEDDIGPAVVNIFADDVVIKNMTIENTQPQVGPHAFAIYGTGTRTILENCTVVSKGGDTVSLWNYKAGMYYHNHCFFQGAVDFVCPRGWCYISNSEFYELKNTAAVWHAAPTNPNQKFVLKGCCFSGADSFYLARHHYDAQFYFLHCTFPALMRNKPIEHVQDAKNPKNDRPYLFGDRYYFFECNRNVGNYNWFSNNVSHWPGGLSPEDITPQWTFDGKWNPLDSSELKIVRYELAENEVFLWFDEPVMPLENLVMETQTGKILNYVNGTGRERLEFESSVELNENDFSVPPILVSGNIQNIQARVCHRKYRK